MLKKLDELVRLVKLEKIEKLKVQKVRNFQMKDVELAQLQKLVITRKPLQGGSR